MVGVADVRYVPKCREAQYGTFAFRKFWGQNKNRGDFCEQSTLEREHVGARNTLKVDVHPAFSIFIRKLMQLQPSGSRCVSNICSRLINTRRLVTIL